MKIFAEGFISTCALAWNDYLPTLETPESLRAASQTRKIIP
jgi:hypothetical protein